ncbi:hypothetical protein MT325_m130R [Paramecium bursaria chlorella virus MT325]|uniref:Uncharacterized protein m130R n=1 Tax=Paramecium bursaria Chlorella virus MT325 TaxID=346932 RepID=A7ITL0_PBCVM|nr:hypothetical protein MT325_m130R [Paramecium bursaria chlorella virus MT325]
MPFSKSCTLCLATLTSRRWQVSARFGTLIPFLACLSLGVISPLSTLSVVPSLCGRPSSALVDPLVPTPSTSSTRSRTRGSHRLSWATSAHMEMIVASPMRF